MLNYDPKPLAIEVRILPQGGSGEPEFTLATIPVAQIAAVMPLRGRGGDGCTISLTIGETVICSNAYRDVSDAIVGDAKRFTSLPEVEALVLSTVEIVEEGEPEIGDELPGDILNFLEDEDALDTLDDDDDDEEGL
jgi:hypothetical protein